MDQIMSNLAGSLTLDAGMTLIFLRSDDVAKVKAGGSEGVCDNLGHSVGLTLISDAEYERLKSFAPPPEPEPISDPEPEAQPESEPTPEDASEPEVAPETPSDPDRSEDS